MQITHRTVRKSSIGFALRLPEIPGSEFGTVVCNMVLLCWLETFWRMI